MIKTIYRTVLSLLGIACILYILIQFIFLIRIYNNLPVQISIPSLIKSVFGRNPTLPNKYSNLLPIYPDSKIISILEGKDYGKDNTSVSLRVNHDVNDIIAWYTVELQKMGYKIYDSSTLHEVTNIWFSNDRYKGNVTISNRSYAHPGQREATTRINLWLKKQ